MPAKKLTALGVPFVYDRFEGWPHVMDAAEAVKQRCLWPIDEFLGEHLPISEVITKAPKQ
jgi:hypothetical protein